MIWQNYHVQCDRCNTDHRIPVYPFDSERDTVLKVLDILGWKSIDGENFCPVCKDAAEEERKNEHPGKKALREWTRESNRPH